MKKVFLSLLFLPLFFLVTTLAYADHSVDFNVTQVSGGDYPTSTNPYRSNYYTFFTDIPFVTPVPANNSLGSCSLVDNSTNESVDNNENLYEDSSTEDVIVISNISKSSAPVGWTSSSSYHLQCTTDTNSINSDDFNIAVTPTIIHVDQNNNLIDVYFSPVLDNYPNSSGHIFLDASNWFDELGYPNCENNVTYSGQTVSVCHFDLNNDPELPSTDNAHLFIGGAFFNNIYYGDYSYSSFSVNSISPQVKPLSGGTINAGDTYSENGSFTDFDSTSWTGTVDYGDGSGVHPLTLNSDNTFSLNHQYVNVGTYTVTVNITDNQGNIGTVTAQVIVNNNNTAPTVGAVSVSSNPVQTNHSTTATASFADANTSDTHTAVWDWGDGTTSNKTVTESNGSGSVSDNHTYTTAGSHTITLTVTDNTNMSGTAQYVVAVSPTNTFKGANLSHLNYNGADFSNLDLTKTNGSNAQFQNVNFTSANLTQSNFSNSNLQGSNFTNANLTKANLSNTNLTNTNFTGANLTQANLSNAVVTGVTYSNTTCPNGSNSNNHNNSCAGQGGGL